MKMRAKFLSCLLFFAVVPAAAISIVSVLNAKQTILQTIGTHLNAVADSETLRLEDRLQADRDLLHSFTTRLVFRQVLARYLAEPVDADFLLMATSLEDIDVNVPRVLQASIVLPDGTVLISTDPAERGVSYAGREVFERGKTDVVIDDLYLDPDGSGHVNARIGGPLIYDNAVIGVLILDTVADYLNDVNAPDKGLGDTGEIVISRRLPSMDAQILTPLRFDPAAALTRIVPRDLERRPAAKIFDTHEDFFVLNSIDYREKTVIAAVRFVADPGWALAVKIDADEAFIGLENLNRSVIALMLLIVACSAPLAFVVSRFLAGRIDRLRTTTQSIASGDLGARARVTGSDELSLLGRNINEMAAQLERFYGSLERQVEEKTADLREANAFLDSIIENIPNMIFLKDAKELRFVRFNKAGEQLLGYDRTDLIGKNDYDFFPQEQADAFTAKDRKVLDGGTLVDIPQEPIQTRLQGERFLHTRKIPINGPDGKPAYLLGISEDITEQKQALEQIQMFQHAVSSSTDGIVITDPTTRIVYVNPAWQQINGYDSSEVIGKSVGLLETDKTPRKVLQAMRDAIYLGRPFSSRDVFNRRKDGSVYPARVTIYPVYSEERALLYYVGIHADITDQMRVDAAKSHFVSLASHQLRTPLTTVRWVLSHLSSRREWQDGDRDMVTKACEASRQMADTIHVMLQLSQIEAEEIAPHRENVPVRELLDEVVRMHALLFKRRGTPVEVRCPDDLRIATDASLLREILSNLLSNASKYSPPEASIVLQASARGSGMDIAVTDHGYGVPKDEEKHLGSLFFRASNILDKEESGTGIGLHLVYTLVRLLHGTIVFRATEGGGSTFIVHLPSLSDSHTSA